MKKLFVTVGLVVVLQSLTGCAYFKKNNINVNTTAVVATIAAKDGVYLALQQHPEWRGEFELAYNNLVTLSKNPTININTLSSIIQQLPIKELKGPTAQIIIGDVAIIVASLAPNNGEIINEEKFADARVVINAIITGMRSALDAPVVGG